MSDFIFVSGYVEKNVLSRQLENNYELTEVTVKELNFDFGSIAFVENRYNGFKEIETDDFLFIIIGGPLLDFCENDFIAGQNTNDGSKAIYERWKIQGVISWHRDLNGPFVVVHLDKKNGTIEIITDLMSFIPVYSFQFESQLILSTHVDSIAIHSHSRIDDTSLVDFILNKVITYPFTLYENIFQLDPASIFEFLFNEKILKSKSFYWKPLETEKSCIKNIDLEIRLRNSFTNYLEKIFKSKPNAACFLSGGEDSRTVLSGIPKHISLNSFIFIDNINHEVNIATKVAKVLDSEIVYFFRDKEHYLNIFEEACKLIGTSGDFTHAHTLGISESLNLMQYDVVLGGFLSDTLLKGHHLPKRHLPNIFDYLPLPEVESKNQGLKVLVSSIFNQNLLNELNSRRLNHFKIIKELRPNSATEWFNIWPITMHLDFPNIHFNRRLFKSFEPFTFSEIVKISAEATNSHKLNRDLFHKAMQPLLYRTRWIPHINGSYPYFSWHINIPLKFIEKIRKNILRKIFKKNTECVFSDWNSLCKTEKFNSLEANYLPVFMNSFHNIFSNNFGPFLKLYKNLTPDQKRIILQVSNNIVRKNQNLDIDSGKVYDNK